MSHKMLSQRYFCCTWPILFRCASREAGSCGNFFSGLFLQWYACFHFLSTHTTDTSHEKSAILFQQKRLLWTNDLQIDPATLFKGLWNECFLKCESAICGIIWICSHFTHYKDQHKKIFGAEFPHKNVILLRLKNCTPCLFRKIVNWLFFIQNMQMKMNYFKIVAAISKVCF